MLRGVAALINFLQSGTGAVWRFIQDKLRESYSVKDFGATGDGVTDDTAAIQLAVTAAFANLRSLYFPAGTYIMSSTITMGNTAPTAGIYCHFYGDGRNSIIKVNAANVNPFLWQGPNPDLDGAGNRYTGRVLLEKLLLQGPLSGASNTNSIGFRFYGVQGIWIREVHCEGWYDAHHFRNCDIVNVTTPLLQGNYNGLNSSASGYAIAGEGQFNSFNVYGGLIANCTNYGISYVGGHAPGFFGVNFAVNATSMVFSPNNAGGATVSTCPTIHGCYLEGDTATMVILGGGNGIVRGLSLKGGNFIAGSATPIFTVSNYSNALGRGSARDFTYDISFVGSSLATQASSAEKLDIFTINGTVIGDITPAAVTGTTVAATGLCDLSAAGAGQVKFPATQNASSNANTLDDYEEGPWTPANPQVSLTVTSATYTKIGRSVHADMFVTWPATADGNAATITGLPFTVGATTASFVIGYTNYGAAITTAASSTTTVIDISTFAGAAVTNAQMSGKLIILSGTYSV